MRNVLLLVSLACFGFGAAGEPAAGRSVDRPKRLKVLMIGNSFSQSVLRETPAFAKAAGVTLDIVQCGIGGCPFDRHWANVEKASDPSFKPYGIRWSCASDPTKTYPKTSNLTVMLATDRWDVVTIQQASGKSAFYDTYQPYADNLIAKIRELAPQAQIVIQETWSYSPYDGRLEAWKMNPTTMHAALKDAYSRLATKHGLSIIPTGDAVQLFRQRLPVDYGTLLTKADIKALKNPALIDFHGDVAGSSRWAPERKRDGKESQEVKLHCDFPHFNARGHYLQACVWTAALFGIDPTRVDYRPVDLPERDAKLMRECARDAVLACRKPALPAAPDFERLSFNNPEAIVDLKPAFLEMFTVYDVDNDGDLDIVARAGEKTENGWPWCGTFLYRNPTPKGVKDPDPVFPKPETEFREKIDWYKTWEFWGGQFADGRPIGEVHYYTRQMYQDSIKSNGTRWAGHSVSTGNRLRRDLDGDGIPDLLIQVGDSNQAAWSNRYDERGNYMEVQGRKFVYFLKGLGNDRFAEQRMLTLENTLPLEVYGGISTLMVEDWDRDGDYDIIMIDYMDTIVYFENVGTRTDYAFTSGRFLRNLKNERIHGELCMSIALSLDWDGDGHKDLMTMEEDSRVGWYRNTGKLLNGMPAFDSIRYFRQRADDLTFGVLATPSVIDWDGDGDQDIISGNSMGQIAFIENLSGPGVEKPKWAAPKLLAEPDGKSIRLIAGHGGSIQGPIEWKWGYSVVCAGDWDGDGLPDVMANSVRGEYRWWRNIGTRTQPKLDFARGIEVAWEGPQPEMPFGWLKPKRQKNPKELLSQWRSTPLMTDLNRDGLMDLITIDTEGYIAYYERAKTSEGKLIVKPPRRCLVDESGKPVIFSDWKYGYGGGRIKIGAIDWNHDGKTDLLIQDNPNVTIWQQVKAKDGTWIFHNLGDPAAKRLANHDPQACACDFNGDGFDDILMSSLDGFFYYLRNPLSGGAH